MTINKTNNVQCNYSLLTDKCPDRPWAVSTALANSILVLLFSITPYDMGHYFGQFESGVLVLSSPHLCIASSSLAEQYEELKNSWLIESSISTSQQQLRHQCVINISPKSRTQSLYQSLWRKLTLFQPKPGSGISISEQPIKKVGTLLNTA